MRITIDAMGGDNAPKSMVEGAVLAANKYDDIEIILVGSSDEIEKYLPKDSPTNVKVQNASEVILTEDEPVKSVRRKKDSSLVVAARMVKENQADAVISAGNTGALMTAGVLIAGRMKGIERPALGSVLPTVSGNGVLLLDMGANMDPTSEQLVQYSLMGKIYAEQVLKINNPRVGLLNVGTEDTKGNELMKNTFPLLKEAPINFVGNVEARDITNGVCDILICDGFSGNIVLKLTEGLSSSIFHIIKEELMGSLQTKIGALLLKPAFRNIKKSMDYTEVGGAPLLGINGAFIKAHGSSNSKAVMNAVRQARTFLKSEVKEKIEIEINKI